MKKLHENIWRAVTARLLAGKFGSRDERRKTFVNTTRGIPWKMQGLSIFLFDCILQGMGKNECFSSVTWALTERTICDNVSAPFYLQMKAGFL